MKYKILNILKENLVISISLILITLFPITLLIGSSVINTSIVLMNVFFLIHIYTEKKFQVFNNDLFYFLCILWLFFIINTLLNYNFEQNYSRAFGFFRFILLILLLSYFFSYKDFKYKKVIFDIWTIIFIFVSLDLVFEFIFGFNLLGFKSNFDGRLSGLMGDQLKIGHWYLCFSLIILSNFYHSNKFYLFLFLSILISFLIGERANFIRLFLAICFIILIARQFSIKNLGILIFSITTIIYVANYMDKLGAVDFKARYVNQIINIVKLDSVKEINKKNNYTPMYFNAYNIFKENKLLGVGLGSFAQKSHEKYRKTWHPLKNPIRTINGYNILPNTHPHQYHFEILATLGLTGYIFIFLFLLYFFIKNILFYKNNKNPINLTSFLMLFVFCLPLLPTGSFFTTYGASIFWLNFALMNLGNVKNINH